MPRKGFPPFLRAKLHRVSGLSLRSASPRDFLGDTSAHYHALFSQFQKGRSVYTALMLVNCLCAFSLTHLYRETEENRRQRCMLFSLGAILHPLCQV